MTEQEFKSLKTGDEFWSFDYGEERWTKVKVGGVGPEHRYIVGYDKESGDLVTFYLHDPMGANSVETWLSDLSLVNPDNRVVTDDGTIIFRGTSTDCMEFIKNLRIE